jgi:hypothetical protein
MDVKPTWSPTWRAMDDVSWPAGFCVKHVHIKEMGLILNWETMTIQNLITLDLLQLNV